MFFFLCSPLLFANPPASLPEPSEHEEQRGKYRVKDPETGYHYYVKVPSSYEKNRPAGIHLFFHGQGGHKGASSFHQWNKHFLEPYRLIGINMQYMDGDNSKDKQKKAKAAMNAVAQVMADYRVIPRGVISSFSGGGIPHAVFYNRRGGAIGWKWPFNHSALYSSNFWKTVRDQSMSWYVEVGGKEWNLADLGSTNSDVYRNLIQMANRYPEFMLNIEPKQGHTISDVSQSARMFHRSDLARSPFLWAPGYEHRTTRQIARRANQGKLGSAFGDIDRELNGGSLKKPLEKELKRLRTLIRKRADQMVSVCENLADRDALLFTYYSKTFKAKLQGMEAGKRIRELIRKHDGGEYRERVRMSAKVRQQLLRLVKDGRIKNPDKNKERVKNVLETISNQSLTGRVLKQLLDAEG